MLTTDSNWYLSQKVPSRCTISVTMVTNGGISVTVSIKHDYQKMGEFQKLLEMYLIILLMNQFPSDMK